MMMDTWTCTELMTPSIRWSRSRLVHSGWFGPLGVPWIGCPSKSPLRHLFWALRSPDVVAYGAAMTGREPVDKQHDCPFTNRLGIWIVILIISIYIYIIIIYITYTIIKIVLLIILIPLNQHHDSSHSQTEHSLVSILLDALMIIQYISYTI